MSRFITIRIEIPDGVAVRVAGSPPDDADDEALPPPTWAAQAARPAHGGNGASMSTCQLHRLPWRSVPAGISKKTGRAYTSFLACPEPGCDQRPH